MRYRNHIIKNIVNVILVAVLIVSMVPALGVSVKADTDTFTLGTFDAGTNKFKDATGSGSTKYKSLTISYGSAPTDGEEFVLSDSAGFTKDTTNSSSTTTVINIGNEGKTCEEIAEYVSNITFKGSGVVTDRTITVTIKVNADDNGITANATIGKRVTFTNNANDLKNKLSFNLNGSGSLNIDSTTTEGTDPTTTISITSTPGTGYRFDNLMAVSSANSPVAMTKVSGSSDTSGNLFDDDSSTTTIWTDSYTATANNHEFYVIFKATNECVITDYTLTTGNDANKNWQTWSLYGGSFAQDSDAVATSKTWNEIDAIESDAVLKGKTNGSHKYIVTNSSKAYKYYMIKVGNSQSYSYSSTSDAIAMAKAVFSGYEVTNESNLTLTQAEGKYIFTLPSDKNVAIMANYLQNYKVKYDGNGAKSNIPTDDTFYAPGDSVNVMSPGSMALDGCKFKGWSDNIDGSGTIYNSTGDNKTFTINKNVTLYAVWQESAVSGAVASGYEGEYDGQEHSIYVDAPDGTTVTYCETETGTYVANAPKYINAGTNKIVYYKVSKEGLDPQTGHATVIINQRPITLQINDKSKEYGSSDPAITWDDFTISSGSYASGDVIDKVTRTTGEEYGQSYQYNQSVSIKNGSGTDVTSNYIITYGTMGKLTITQKTVTVSGITAENKTYDGNTTATLNFTKATTWKVNESDKVSVKAVGTFDSKNVGSAKTVNIKDIELEGYDKGKYKLAKTGQQTSCNANISAKSIKVSGIKAKNKAYDGNTTATLDYSYVKFDGMVDGDNLSVTATGTFSDASIANEKTVTLTNHTLTGTDKDNYTFAGDGKQSDCTASIVNKLITVKGGITAKNKVYDGNNSAELDYTGMVLEGKSEGDDVTVTAIGTFADKNAGENKRVFISGYSLSGSAANQYAIAAGGNQVYTTATITKKQISVSGIKAESKSYDGTVDATLDLRSASYGKIDSDDFNISSAMGSFADKNVGEAKNVTISKITFSGADASNYQPADGYTTTTTADITAIPVTITGVVAKDKVYDGTNTAQLDIDKAVIDGIVAKDKLSFTVNGAFVDRKVGNDKNVLLSDLQLSGLDADNYYISDSQEYTVKANITAKEVVVSGIVAEDKKYDETVAAILKYDNVVLTGLDDKNAVVGEDELGIEATGEFEDKNNGKDKTVYIKSLTLTGEDSDNYVLSKSGQQNTCTADIKGIPVSVSGITAESKTYDGKTNAVLDLSKAVIQGVVEGGKVYVSAVGEFEDAGVGDNKTVKLKSVQLTGKDAGNYELVDTSQTECTADIKPIAVNVSGIVAKNKEYDGNTTATLSFDDVKIDGVLKSDKVSVSAKGIFADKYPGKGKEVTISDLVLTGQKAGNYVFAENGKQEKTSADITLEKGAVIDEVDNGDGTKTVKEVEYKDGQPTNKETEITYGENGIDHIQKITYDKEGQPEKTVTIAMDAEGEISQVVIKDAEGKETVCNDETEVSYGSKKESVEEIKENLKSADLTDNQVGSVLDSYDITPEEMAFLLKDESSTMELLTEAVKVGETENATGGANVSIVGINGTFNTPKEEVLKVAFTPTEIVEMLASAKKTDVVIEFSEDTSDSDDNAEAKQKINELVGEYEDALTFNLDMYKRVSGSKESTKVTEFEKEIGTSFVIPENIRKENRTYRLIGSHKDVATGVITASEITLSVDKNYNASFATKKLCLMALVYTDDDLKAEKIAKKEAEEKEAAEKAAKEKEEADRLAAEKEAAEKAQAEKEQAEKEAAELAAKKAEEEKEAAKKLLEEKATAMKETTKKEQEEKEAAKKAAEEKAAAEKKAAEEKAAAEKKAAEEKAAAEKAAAEELALTTVTSEEMDKNSILINSGLKVDQKASQIDIAWGKVDVCENYDVYVQYCGKAFSEVPDATLDAVTTNISVDKVDGKKLNIKKNYKIYVVGYRRVKGKKIILAKSLTAHVVGRKNAKYTNGKSIKILSSSNIEMNVKDVSLIKAKTNRVAKKKKLLTDSHAKEFRYASTDKKVAIATKTGVIKAVGSGTCTVYVYSRNGYAKKITVTVR